MFPFMKDNGGDRKFSNQRAVLFLTYLHITFLYIPSDKIQTKYYNQLLDPWYIDFLSSDFSQIVIIFRLPTVTQQDGQQEKDSPLAYFINGWYTFYAAKTTRLPNIIIQVLHNFITQPKLLSIIRF